MWVLGGGGHWPMTQCVNVQQSANDQPISSRYLLKERHGRTGGHWVSTQGMLLSEVFCDNVVQGHVELSSPSFG